MIARLTVGIVRAERLRSRGRPMDDKPVVEALARLAGVWSMRVVPVLATAERIVVPKVVGLLRPTILLPASALSGLSAGELEMILAHELAHVRRHDMWVNLLQRLAEAALFFNPALWLLSRRISSLREYCCDELACRGAEPRGGGAHLRYAQALLRVVELSQAAGTARADTAALAASGRSPSELRRRVARLFGEPLREPLQLSRGGFVLLLGLGALLMAGPLLWQAQAEPPVESVRSQIEDAEEPQSDREAMLAYARALAAGDFAALEKTWIFQDDLERDYAQKTAEMFARAKDMRVELVSLKRLSDESLFAMFLMFDGPKQSGKEPSPLPMTFRRQEGQWRCASPWNLRMTVNVQNMGVEKYGRRAQTQGMIAMSFGSEKSSDDWIAVLKAQAEAIERLAGPPYDLSQYEPIAKQIREQIEEQEAALKTVESREDLWRLVLEKEGKAILPEAGDFYLSFYLEAGKDTPNARSLPFADEVEPFLAEPFPCLTEEEVLKAEVVKNPDRNAPRIEVTLTDEGAKYFAKTTQLSIGKRLAIVVKGKVVAAPVIHSTISGGKAAIEGSFSFEEAEEIVEGLNAYRKEAREFLDNMDKDEGQPEGEPPGAKAEALPASPSGGRRREGRRHEGRRACLRGRQGNRRSAG